MNSENNSGSVEEVISQESNLIKIAAKEAVSKYHNMIEGIVTASVKLNEEYGTYDKDKELMSEWIKDIKQKFYDFYMKHYEFHIKNDYKSDFIPIKISVVFEFITSFVRNSSSVHAITKFSDIIKNITYTRYKQYIKTTDAIDDCIQTTYKKIHEFYINHEEDVNYLPIKMGAVIWLTENVLRSIYRIISRNKEDPNEEIIIEVLTQKSSHPDSVTEQEETVIAKERKSIINKIFQILKPKEMAVLENYYLKEMTFDEIGKLMGVSRSRPCEIARDARSKMLKYFKKNSINLDDLI